MEVLEDIYLTLLLFEQFQKRIEANLVEKN